MRIAKVTFVIGTMCSCSVATNSWVHRYVFNFSLQKSEENSANRVAEQSDIKPFNQLLFAWNATTRPTAGTVSFFVRVRNSVTKEWDNWHHALDWGSAIQSSYTSEKVALFSDYHHVRLEMKKGISADGFQLVALSDNQDAVQLITNFFVTTVDFSAFKAESVETLGYLSSVMVESVPLISQKKLLHAQAKRLCSPTSCAMLAESIGSKVVDINIHADDFYDSGLDTYGSWPFNMAFLSHMSDGRYSFFHTRLNSFVDLHEQLQRSLACAVSVRGSLPGAPQSYPEGHLLVVVGFDALTNEVICHDPAQEKVTAVRTRYKLADFLLAWERSRRLTYWIEPLKNNDYKGVYLCGTT